MSDPITCGFGWRFNLELGTMRQWAMGRDGVKRWVDNNQPVETEKDNEEEKTE